MTAKIEGVEIWTRGPYDDPVPYDTEDSDDDHRHRTPVGGIEALDARLAVFERKLEHVQKAQSAIDRQHAIDRAMVLGVDGQPGRLGVLEGNVKTVEASHGARLGALETWRTTVTAKMGVAILITGPLGGVITALLLRWLLP